MYKATEWLTDMSDRTYLIYGPLKTDTICPYGKKQVVFFAVMA